MNLNVIPDIALGRAESRLQQLRPDREGAAERARLREAAKDFEAVLLELMVKEMRKNVPESPIFGEDNGRKIFEEMLDSQYVRLMVQRGGLGLADLLVQQLDPKLGARGAPGAR